MSKKALPGTLFLLLIMMALSCENDNNFDVDVSEVPSPHIKIKRYEKAMFAIPPDSFLSMVASYRDSFPLFLNGDMSDTNALLQLKAFFTDKYMIELNDLVQKEYRGLEDIESQLDNAFRRFKYYFPNEHVPVFYSYVSGLDIKFPVKFADTSVVIGLDLYLGEDTKAYKVSGIPKYSAHWMNRYCIVPDVMREICSGYLPESKANANLLEKMVESGKKLYFIKSMIPSLADSLLFKYTASQLAWIRQFEPDVWSFIVENSLLYDNKKMMLRKFMNDGPFTDYFSKKSPPRLGEYIGWQIVRNYMNKTGATLRDLLFEENAQKILKLSRYKPEI